MLFRIPQISDGLLEVSDSQKSKRTFIKRKGNIDSHWLAILAAVALTPLLLMLTRAYAMPGAGGSQIFDFGLLRAIGAALNSALSLQWVPPADRPEIFYLLLLPLGALIIATARLTFGLRIMGFRAILIGIGFQEAGIIPSLCLIAVVVGTIAAIRPSMRRIRLPLIARVSVILCTAAIIMVCALMIAPIIRSEIVWGVAFFPVIIVAMLAEGIAKTLARDDLITAIWRAAWTIIVAFIFAGASMIPVIRYSILQFPELMITQLITIIFVAEFLDFRLLEAWPKHLKRYFDGVQLWRQDKPRIAVVRNRWNRNVIGRLGQSAPSRYRKRSVQKIVDGLRNEGFQARVFDGDLDLPSALRNYIPPNTVNGRPGGLVLNLGTGTQGIGRFTQVPAMLELAGIAYTGPSPIALSVLQDRYAMLTMLQGAGIKVPDSYLAVAPGAETELAKIKFPVMVRSRFNPSIKSTKVRSQRALIKAVERLESDCKHSAIIESCVSGNDVRVAIVGNETLECLPIVERLKGGQKICPAAISKSRAQKIRECAMKAYRITGCRDYARIDLRFPRGAKEPVVKQVVWDNVLAKRGTFLHAAGIAGYTLPQLMHRIVEEALFRYGLAADLRVETEDNNADDSTIDVGKRMVAK